MVNLHNLQKSNSKRQDAGIRKVRFHSDHAINVSKNIVDARVSQTLAANAFTDTGYRVHVKLLSSKCQQSTKRRKMRMDCT